jgi:PAS domain S-box-containing protein
VAGRLNLDTENAADRESTPPASAQTAVDKKFRQLVESAPEPFFVVGRSGRLIDANRRASDDLGYTRDELLSLEIRDFDPEWHAERVARLYDSLTPGASVTRETFLRRKDGTSFPVEVHVGLLDAELQTMVVLARDITERRRSDEERHTLIAVIERTSDFVGILASDISRVVYVNPAGRNLIGLDTLPEDRPLTVYDFHAPEHREQIREMLAHVARHGSWEGEFELRHFKTGALIPTHSRVSLNYDPKTGQTLSLSTISRDITERRLMERAVRESEARLKRIIESATDAIVTVDAGLRVTLANDTAERVFRCRPSEMINRSFEGMLSPQLKSVFDSYRRTSEAGGGAQPLWIPDGIMARRADGEEFALQGSISTAEVSGDKLYTMILRDLSEHQRTEEALGRLAQVNAYLEEEIRNAQNFTEVVGNSPAMRSVLNEVARVAPTEATVLLTGETGSGKESIARMIHQLSRRHDGALIKVNCATLPAGLVESELFGHERGAFTGAIARKKGRFELAHNETVFLDEIGELPPEAQSKLLRVLQEREFERVGGTQTIKVDVRVIAATNRDLAAAVGAGQFRADLFYRLNVYPIHVPPLRERREDIPMLASYFVGKIGRRIGKSVRRIDPPSLALLAAYDWPGNVRELANVIERAIILCEGETLRAEHLTIARPDAQPRPGGAGTLAELDRAHIVETLKRTDGRIGGSAGAAARLGIKRTTLISRMKKLGIGSLELSKYRR